MNQTLNIVSICYGLFLVAVRVVVLLEDLDIFGGRVSPIEGRRLEILELLWGLLGRVGVQVGGLN